VKEADAIVALELEERRKQREVDDKLADVKEEA
jgi:hypothetical protein